MLKLDWCSFDAAKYAVEHWHYSKRMPTSKLVKIGVWESDKFIGAIVFGGGPTHHLLTQYNLECNEGCELVRVALKKHTTPVSRIVSIAIKLLRKQCPGLKLIVSFADPREGHVGSIYQAMNWIYTGKSNQCMFPILDGRLAHPRTLSERVRKGTMTRDQCEYIMLEGKHRYLYPLTNDIKKQIEPLRQNYPKHIEHDSSASVFHTLGSGANPTDMLQSNKD